MEPDIGFLIVYQLAEHDPTEEGLRNRKGPREREREINGLEEKGLKNNELGIVKSSTEREGEEENL